MGIASEPKPCKYFAALLSAEAPLISDVEADLCPLFGSIDRRSDILPWMVSRFYEPEMGGGLLRRFVSFERLRSPADLPEIKLRAHAIEDRYRGSSGSSAGRRINIDPGYIEAGKLVLASTKNANHRVYLSRGIYAEATLLYQDGGFQPCAHTYRDYLWPETLAFVRAVRLAYLDQLRACA